MKKLLFLFASLLAGIFVACHQDFDITTATPIGPIPAANVQASLYGRVMDPYNNPLPDATVIVNGQTCTTNNQGLFFMYNKTLDQNGTYVQARYPGYFPAARFAYPHAGSSTYLEISMLSKYTQGSFSTTTNAEVPVNGGASISIPAGSLVTDSGLPYSGPYRVAASWLDPSAPETFNQMPGDLRAQNADGEAKVLKTFGMIGVELSSPTGQALQIASGKKATDVFPEMTETAPDILTQMSFEEIILLITTLPEGPRTVFNLAVFNQFAHDEIAALLQIPAGTSRSLLSRARKLLQEKILNRQKHELARI